MHSNAVGTTPTLASPPEHLDAFCAALRALPLASERTLAPGARFALDRPQTLSVIVLEGAMGLEITNEQSETRIVEVFGRGASITELAWALVREPSLGRLVALQPSVILRVPSRVVMDTVLRDPEFAQRLEEDRARQAALSLTYHALLRMRGSRPRVAAALLFLQDALDPRVGTGSGAPIRLTQDVLANIADVSRQTLNQELAWLQRARIVCVTRASVCVLRRDALLAVRRGTFTLETEEMGAEREVACPPAREVGGARSR